jgi:aminocarboxymuconate-semialdehyde decarboxylase
MIVDSHAHLVPPELLRTIRREHARFAAVRIIEEGDSVGFAFASGKPTRPVSTPLSDLALRRAWLNQQGIDRQVCGGWVDMFGYELPPPEGEAWSRTINDGLLAAAAAEPAIVPLASVPLQDGVRAAQVLTSAVADGFPGAMIGTLPRGIGSVLDAADLDPFWAAADDLGAAIHIHPSFDSGDIRTNDYGLQNAVGRITDAMVAVARLVCKGYLTRYRNVRFIVPMGGAGLPFLLGRLVRNGKLTSGLADPIEEMARLYTDTILHDARVLRFVLSMLGPDHLMMGSDMPFPIGDHEPMEIVGASGVDAATAARINGGLAAEVFRLRPALEERSGSRDK